MIRAVLGTRSHVLSVSLAATTLIASTALADELFVTDRATDRILSFDPETGAFNRVLVDSGLLIPSSLAFGPGGFLYVGNLGTGQVLKVDPVTGATSPYTIIGGPGGLLYDEATNTIFVSEFGNFDGDEIYQVDAGGNIINVIDSGTDDDPSPKTGRTGMALRDGDLYVGAFADEGFFAGKVRKFVRQINFAFEGVVASDPAFGFGGANGLGFSESGDLYVAGLLNQGVKKFNIDGGPDLTPESFGPSIAYPAGLLIETEGESEVMYVTSLGNDNPTDPIYGAFLFPGAVYKFDVATGGLIGGQPLITSRGASDYDNDGVVDQNDLPKWVKGFGESGPGSNVGDGDNDGDSDGEDFLLWQRNAGGLGDFQPTAVALYRTPVEIAAVPEPASMTAATMALAALVGLRRRRKLA